MALSYGNLAIRCLRMSQPIGVPENLTTTAATKIVLLSLKARCSTESVPIEGTSYVRNGLKLNAWSRKTLCTMAITLTLGQIATQNLMIQRAVGHSASSIILLLCTLVGKTHHIAGLQAERHAFARLQLLTEIQIRALTQEKYVVVTLLTWHQHPLPLPMTVRLRRILEAPGLATSSTMQVLTPGKMMLWAVGHFASPTMIMPCILPG